MHSRTALFAEGPNQDMQKLLELIIGGVPGIDESSSYMHYLKEKNWEFQAVFQAVQNILHADGFFYLALEWISTNKGDSHPVHFITVKLLKYIFKIVT